MSTQEVGQVKRLLRPARVAASRLHRSVETSQRVSLTFKVDEIERRAAKLLADVVSASNNSDVSSIAEAVALADRLAAMARDATRVHDALEYLISDTYREIRDAEENRPRKRGDGERRVAFEYHVSQAGGAASGLSVHLEQAAAVVAGLGQSDTVEDAVQLGSSRVDYVSQCLVAMAVQILPPNQRDRYSEEWRAELLDIPRRQRWGYGFRLVRSSLTSTRRTLKRIASQSASEQLSD
jgi:hypothetical protein